MKAILVALCAAALLIPSFAMAQDKKDAPRKGPTAAQAQQQDRMKECNDKAASKKGDERRKFISACLKSGPDKGGDDTTAQQEKMKACNKQASDKKLAGTERRNFLSQCLKG